METIQLLFTHSVEELYDEVSGDHARRRALLHNVDLWTNGTRRGSSGHRLEQMLHERVYDPITEGLIEKYSPIEISELVHETKDIVPACLIGDFLTHLPTLSQWKASQNGSLEMETPEQQQNIVGVPPRPSGETKD